MSYPQHISRRRCWQIQQSISKYTRPFLCTSQRWKAYYDWSMCFANVGLEPWPLVTTYKHSTCCHLYRFWQHTPTLFYTKYQYEIPVFGQYFHQIGKVLSFNSKLAVCHVLIKDKYVCAEFQITIGVCVTFQLYIWVCVKIQLCIWVCGTFQIYVWVCGRF